MKRKCWSKAEVATLRMMYATWPRTEIERALSRRTWRQIVVKAHKLGLRRTKMRAFDAAMTRGKAAPVKACEIVRTLRAERVAQRKTARALSTGIGYSPGCVTRWEKGEDTPGMQPLKDWAQALGMKIAVVPA